MYIYIYIFKTFKGFMYESGFLCWNVAASLSEQAANVGPDEDIKNRIGFLKQAAGWLNGSIKFF
jgi:hypothetical protein